MTGVEDVGDVGSVFAGIGCVVVADDEGVEKSL